MKNISEIHNRYFTKDLIETKHSFSGSKSSCKNFDLKKFQNEQLFDFQGIAKSF